MSSGSFKDLSRTITNAALSLTLPLPTDLVEVLHAYLDKHADYGESDAQRLHDELLDVYQSSIRDHPSRHAPFLAILRTLKPGIRGSGRLLQWWQKLSTPILTHLGSEKGLAVEARHTLLGILVYDEDDEQLQDARTTSEAVAESLMAICLEKSRLATDGLDAYAKFVEGQLQLILIAFGKKRPKDLMMTLNKFFVKKESRIPTLALLCDFFRHQPPHLYQMLHTPLWENLLRCLQIDTSTRTISLAMTAMIMFLPHIPQTTSKHLPALFNIYTRMLFWDREREAGDILPNKVEDGREEEDGVGAKDTADDGKWQKLSWILESEDVTVPELLHYFTFLYGLYPINFMDYVRKPQRYLRHANFPGADDLDVQPLEIRQRSEPFRRVHLLHPNFFNYTIESEITDINRWMKIEAPGVVAQCMALYVPSEDEPHRIARSRGDVKKVEPNLDVPEQALLDSEAPTPFQSRHTSWRNTQSTAVASPDLQLNRKLSQTSHSVTSVADSPSLRPLNRLDSPTLPAQPGSRTSAQGSIYQTITNDSVASLALSNNQDSSHVDTYLASLKRDEVPRSPSLRPSKASTADPSRKIAYLQREIQLLKNDLNFEQYLKQQHLSHIGQLRRRQIREARVEAETQNLINSNRGLKLKLEETKRLNAQMKKENEKSKTHSRKWEADLTAKLRILREEQKKWNREREQLKTDLDTAVKDVFNERQVIIKTEKEVLSMMQKVTSAESNLNELEDLRVDVEKMRTRIRIYEAAELAAWKAHEDAKAALSRVEILEMELRARDEELAKARQAFEKDLRSMRTDGRASELYEGGHVKSLTRKEDVVKQLIDSALVQSRQRIVEQQKAYNHLLKRFTQLQSSYIELREQLDFLQEDGNHPLLSGGRGSPEVGSGRTSPSPSPRARKHANSESDIAAAGERISPFLGGGRPARLETSYIPPRTSNPTSPVSSSGNGAQHFTSPSPFSPSVGGSSGRGSVDATETPKVKSQSEVRVYGRGGVQNVNKKPKDEAGEGSGKKEKKKGGIRGIRAFS